MADLLDAIRNLDFLTALAGIVVLQIIHELEEWNIITWYHRHFVDLPPITARSTRLWIAFITTVAIAWCIVAVAPADPSFAAYVFFPGLALVLQNALQHVYWQFYFKRYAPGVITAVFCLIPASVGLTAWVLIEQYVSIWYVTLCFGLALPSLIQTVQAGNRMTPFIRSINLLGLRLERMLS